jgi:hypothetical protein
MRVEVKLKNVKLIEDLQTELFSGNLYLIRAKNNKGKSQ